MGATDIERQKINVYRMKLLGATVVPVTSGSATLKDALNEAMRDWVTNVRDTFYIIGTVAGPDRTRGWCATSTRWSARGARADAGGIRPPPGRRDRLRGRRQQRDRRLPRVPERSGRAPGRRGSGGEGIATGHHAASLAAGRPGVLHGNRTYVICDDDGQIIETHSGLRRPRLPGVGPEHAFLKDSGRADYVGVTDDEALAAFHLLARTEGILPALESSHAIAQAIKLARDLPEDALVLCNLSGAATRTSTPSPGARA